MIAYHYVSKVLVSVINVLQSGFLSRIVVNEHDGTLVFVDLLVSLGPSNFVLKRKTASEGFINHLPIHYQPLLEIVSSIVGFTGHHVSPHPKPPDSEPLFTLEGFKGFFRGRKRLKLKHEPFSLCFRLFWKGQIVEGFHFSNPLWGFEQRSKEFLGGFFFAWQFKQQRFAFVLSWRNNLPAKRNDEPFVPWHVPNVEFLHVCQKFDCIFGVAHLMEDACEVFDARVYLLSLTCWLGVEPQSFPKVPLTGLSLLGLFISVLRHGALEVIQLAISVLLM